HIAPQEFLNDQEIVDGLVHVCLTRPAIGVVPASENIKLDEWLLCILVPVVLMQKRNLVQRWVAPVEHDINPVALLGILAVVFREGDGIWLDREIYPRAISTNNCPSSDCIPGRLALGLLRGPEEALVQ